MAIAQAERTVFGQAFDPAERFALGVVGGVTVCAHAVYVLAVLAFVSAVLVAVLAFVSAVLAA